MSDEIKKERDIEYMTDEAYIKRQFAILDALGKDYINMCLIDPERATAAVLKTHQDEQSNEPMQYLEIQYYQMCEESIAKYVAEEQREKLKAAIQLNLVTQKIAENQEYSFVFEVVMNGQKHDCQMKYIRLKDSNYILMGFRLIDALLAAEKEQKNKLAEEAVIARQKTRQDRAIIRNNAEELRKERMFLDVLCKDYASVYFFDIKNDTIEVLKIEQGINAAQVLGVQTRQRISYSEKIKNYCDACVLDVDKKEFLSVMDQKNIIRELKKTDRLVYRYQSSPNQNGHSHFEVQVVRIQQDGFENTALLAFRHIDEIITAEQKYQQKLEDALQKERLSNEVLLAISKIYYAIFRIDLEQDTYEEISSDKTVHHLTGTFGCASEEMIELCKTFVVPEYQERIMHFFDVKTLSQRLQAEETIAEEYLAKDGNWHTARFIVKRRNAKGDVTHVLYVTRLISDEKRREQNWIAIAEEANKANAAKTDFLRRMSHDIRTPINGILGMLEMENRHRTDIDKLQECRDKILNATEYLLSIVNNVLDIGKVESGGFILEHKPFDLITLLVKQISMIEIQARENGISFRGGKNMSVIRHRYLMGSPIHLNRILMNLASNAIKYNKKGGTVTLYCRELSCSEHTVVYEFVCRDTGIGMSEEFQKHAFEPFTQEGKASVSSYNGSGLGLSIVKEVIEQMNGTIHMESEEGKGTTFRVDIPFEIDYEAQVQAQTHTVPVPIDVHGRKALLVEDNDLNREIAEMILEDEGLVIISAENGQEAVECFAASQPYTYDFIFMDIMMPVMDGMEATKRIRALQRPDAKTVPILAMSANAFQDDIQQSMEAGMTDYLTKPLSIERVKEAIQKAAMQSEPTNS